MPAAGRNLRLLPSVKIEVFIDELEDPQFVGRNHSENGDLAGIKLSIEPNPELGLDINRIVSQEEISFPFEFYQAKFTTFQGGSYSMYSCPLKHLLVDHSAIGAVSGTSNYIRNLFAQTVDSNQKNLISHQLRANKSNFNTQVLANLTPNVAESFVLRTDKAHSISHSVSLESNGVDIMHEGKGSQSLIKTKFALQRRTEGTQVLLIEEPENHLSHSGMFELLGLFDETHEGQTIISTHSSLIASGLELNNLLIVGEDNSVSFSLSDIDQSTAKFFSKAPDHLLLEFVLSKKVLLVEGSAEFIMLPYLYNRLFPGRTLDGDGIRLIPVGGIKFKRYLTISAQLSKKTAFIQDNDGKTRAEVLNQYLQEDDETSLINNAFQFLGLHEEVLQETFETVLYSLNAPLLDELFGQRVRTNTVKEYLLANKTEVALTLAKYLEDNPEADFTIPNYIEDTFRWLQD
ncbi:ATP-dependent nuclease [Aquimarina algiphila]|uniref:ATP-dependent nuclease n=1 Tax=Aquimarina algiphila TaxID=2047982 RepID=UPI0024922D83|nr:TOPRIM nucleotidyl transferase/hydrolase domain-containing protein [Aquimarina algiphila]